MGQLDICGHWFCAPEVDYSPFNSVNVHSAVCHCCCTQRLEGGSALTGALKILALPKRGGGLTHAKIFLVDL